MKIKDAIKELTKDSTTAGLALATQEVSVEDAEALAKALGNGWVRYIYLNESQISMPIIANVLQHRKVAVLIASNALLTKPITDLNKTGHLVLILNETQKTDFSPFLETTIQKTAEKKARNNWYAFWFSCLSAVYAIQTICITNRYNYDAYIIGALASIVGGSSYGIYPVTNVKKIFAGIASIEVACAGVCLASMLPIADPKAKIAAYTLLTCAYIAASSKVLSSQFLEPADQLGI